MYKFILMISCSLVLLLSCGEVDITKSIDPFNSVQYEEHPLIILTYDETPNHIINLSYADQYITPLDADSIEMFMYHGVETYHPVYLCQRGRAFVNAFNLTKDEKYLNRAIKYGDKLMEISNFIDSIPYPPYMFPYSVHGDSRYYTTAPWYSGMAQGEMMCLLSRLYEFTDDSKYLNFAGKLLSSFYNIDTDKNNKIARIDDSNYYWIEEYPNPIYPGRTLNGFNYAVFGLYDYYRVSSDERAKYIIDLSLTTLKRYLSDFIVEDSGSYYCLGHLALASPGYHALHIKQLQQYYRITGDPFFEIMEDHFINMTKP